MRSFFILFILFLIFASNCLAQCDGLDSFSADNFISARERIKNKKKQKKQKEETTEIGGFSIIGSSSSEFEFYPSEFLTWGIGFSEGLAKVEVNGKYGFIDANGKLVIQPIYSAVNCFSENLAPVEIKNKWGFINKSGQVIIPAKFDFAAPFSENLALVKVGELWGFIDKAGNFAVKPKYEEAESFSEGFAVIGYYDKDYVWTTHKRANGKWQRNFIDKEGKLKFSTAFDGISRNFDGGMALVSRNIGYNGNVISQSYFIDLAGNELWKWNSNLTWFSEDLIIATVSYDKETKREKYSFLDRSGKRVTDKTFDSLSPFSDGLAVARIGDYSGFINTKGDFVIEPKYWSVDSFSEGLASFYENGKVGFIDREGNQVIEPQFNWADSFKEGKAAVAIGEKFGYIDQNGNFIWKSTK